MEKRFYLQFNFYPMKSTECLGVSGDQGFYAEKEWKIPVLWYHSLSITVEKRKKRDVKALRP